MSISGLPVAFDALTPLALFERTVRVFPDQPAVVYGDTRATWAEFAEQVGRFAGALERAGVEPGDRVAVLAPNVPVALAAHFAVLRVRGVLVMINTRLAAEEIAYILDHSGAKIVLVDPELAPRILEAEATRASRPLFVNVEDPVAGALGDSAAGPPLRGVRRRRAGALARRRDRRRAARDLDQLHLGHHRPPEGRHVHAPRGACSTRSARSTCTGSSAARRSCGRCRSSTAMAGASPGPSPARAACT